MKFRHLSDEEVRMMDERNNTDPGLAGGCLMAFVLAMFAVAILLTGCKGHECLITDGELMRDTVYHDVVKHDSVFLKDSVFVREWMKGDTVHVDKVRYVYKYRDRVFCDSFYISHTDTIVRYVTHEITPKKSFYTKLEEFFGGMVMWLGLFAGLMFGLRWVLNKIDEK